MLPDGILTDQLWFLTLGQDHSVCCQAVLRNRGSQFTSGGETSVVTVLLSVGLLSKFWFDFCTFLRRVLLYSSPGWLGTPNLFVSASWYLDYYRFGCLCYWDRVPQCSPDCPSTQYIALSGLKLAMFSLLNCEINQHTQWITTFQYGEDVTYQFFGGTISNEVN